MVTPVIKLLLLPLHNCNFTTVINCNTFFFFFWKQKFAKGVDPQAENHWATTRPFFLKETGVSLCFSG